MELFYEYRTYTEISYSHKHNYAQLILPCEGSLKISTDHRDLILTSDQLFFIPPASLHTFSSSDRNRFLVLDIPLQALPEYHLPDLGDEIVGTLDEAWQALRASIAGEINKPKSCCNALRDLARKASSLLTRDIIPASIKYIHDCYPDTIRLEKLASLEHYAPGYYCDWFYKKTGMTPGEYCQKVRVDEARQLLRYTDLPVTRISEMVGYEHHSSFTRMFTKHQGISPHEYRKMWSKNI